MHAREGKPQGQGAYLSKEMGLVLNDGVKVSIHANSVREHLLLVVKKGVGAKILSEINSLVDHRSTAIAGGASATYDAVSEAPHLCISVELERKERGRRRERSVRILGQKSL